MILSNLPFAPCLFRGETGLDQTFAWLQSMQEFEPSSMELKIRPVDEIFAPAYEIQSDQDHCLTLFWKLISSSHKS